MSGGPDSLALLLLAARAFGPRAHALTVDHGLRPGSAAEARAVADIARAHGIAHTTLAADVEPRGEGLQAAARTARYAALARFCRARGLPLCLTAHHLDDQAETLIMRLARGSGVAGLAGIRPRATIAGLTVLRPLLGVPRATLASLVAAAGLRPADDPANTDLRHDRTAARRFLARNRWPPVARLAASAAHLAEAADALDWAADRAFASLASFDLSGRLLLDPADLPPELRRRLLAAALERLGAPAPRGPALARLLHTLERGRPATLGGVAARPIDDGRWRLSPAPPRRRASAARLVDPVRDAQASLP